jgi:hypothetical protein
VPFGKTLVDARRVPGHLGLDLVLQVNAGHLGQAQRVLSRLAQAPYRHQVTLRIQATAEQIRARLPASVASIESAAGEAGAEAGSWLRVDLRAERLDWVPAVLASIDRPFVLSEHIYSHPAVRVDDSPVGGWLNLHGRRLAMELQ